jgi:UDP-N-acetylglucosamine/UDP-N-acetylgalactosamine diphosphorylase
MIRVASEASQVLIAKVVEAGQGHILDWWNELDAQEQNVLLETIKEVDFQKLQHLINRYLKGTNSGDVKVSVPEPVRALPIPREPAEIAAWREVRRLGQQALEAGEVAVFMAAGTAGSSKGVCGPEGFCPVGPISQKTLFELHAEKVVAINRRYHTTVPFFLMTSAETGEETRAFFKEHRNFTLPQGAVVFLEQPRLPLVDRRGRIVMASRFEIAMAPNGHGGAFLLLQQPDVIAFLRERGVKHVFYFQVDNPFVQVADPAFVGYHMANGADASAKAVRKASPDERVGVFARRGKHLSVIEYSELTSAARRERDPLTQELVLNVGNVGIHLFSVDFLERTRGEEYIVPYHPVEQCTPCLDRHGKRVRRSSPNAIQFECFIFDVFPWAETSLLVEADRQEEFYPLRAKHGRHSPEDVRQAMSEKYAAWLESAGVALPRGDDGKLVGTYEISPLYALDREDFKEKCDASSLEVGDSLYLE